MRGKRDALFVVPVTTRKRIVTAERELSGVWAGVAGRRLRTENGSGVDVLYPGMRPGSAGPDYRDAVIVFDERELVRGDVELHVTAGDWRKHGHASNPAYSHVVLHAVARPDGAVFTELPGGERAPVLVLAPSPRARGLACANVFQRMPDGTMAVLTSAGTERLRARAARMEQDCLRQGPPAVMYRHLSRALGYSANTEAGEHLGVLLGVERVQAAMLGGDGRQRTACALGIAGLLPSQRSLVAEEGGDGEAQALEAAWRSTGGLLPAMPAGSWNLGCVYVNNHPVRRVVALAELLPRLGPVMEAARSLLSGVTPAVRPQAAALERLFVVPGDAYWRGRYDFGRPTRESDLLGASKAREVVVNALLPLLLAVAARETDEGLLRGVVRTFVDYPGSRANAVTAHMRRQLGLPPGRSRAAVDQGLLHLYAEYCRHGLCRACPLAERRPVGNRHGGPEVGGAGPSALQLGDASDP